MSVPKIRFIYRSQDKQEVRSVKQIHKGPINLNNFNPTNPNPSSHEIDVDGNFSAAAGKKSQTIQQTASQETSVIPNVDIISKPTSPNFSQTQAKSPQSIVEPIFAGQPKINKQQPRQSPRPQLKIEQINEVELLKRPQPKRQGAREIQSQIPDGQIVLKSPSFRFVPKQEGELNSCNRKQYLRSVKSQKYLYNGIPQKSEDEFVGCFGCFQRKPKTFKVTHK